MFKQKVAFWITLGEKAEKNHTQTVCKPAHAWDSVTLLQKGIFTLWKERIGRGKRFRRFRNVKLTRTHLFASPCLSVCPHVTIRERRDFHWILYWGNFTEIWRHTLVLVKIGQRQQTLYAACAPCDISSVTRRIFIEAKQVSNKNCREKMKCPSYAQYNFSVSLAAFGWNKRDQRL